MGAFISGCVERFPTAAGLFFTAIFGLFGIFVAVFERQLSWIFHFFGHFGPFQTLVVLFFRARLPFLLLWAIFAVFAWQHFFPHPLGLFQIAMVLSFCALLVCFECCYFLLGHFGHFRVALVLLFLAIGGGFERRYFCYCGPFWHLCNGDVG